MISDLQKGQWLKNGNKVNEQMWKSLRKEVLIQVYQQVQWCKEIKGKGKLYEGFEEGIIDISLPTM